MVVLRHHYPFRFFFLKVICSRWRSSKNLFSCKTAQHVTRLHHARSNDQWLVILRTTVERIFCFRRRKRVPTNYSEPENRKCGSIVKETYIIINIISIWLKSMIIQDGRLPPAYFRLLLGKNVFLKDESVFFFKMLFLDIFWFFQ